MVRVIVILSAAVWLSSIAAPTATADTHDAGHDRIRLSDHLEAAAATAPDLMSPGAPGSADVDAHAELNADCYSLTNSCLLPYYIWALPSLSSSLIRLGEGFYLDPYYFRECTLKTVRVMIYDWVDTNFKEDIEVSVWHDDGFGRPATKLTADTIPAAMVDAHLSDWLEVDFTDQQGGLITAWPVLLHVVVEAPWSTPGQSGVYVLSDGGTDDAANCPEGASNTRGTVYYTDVGAWESHAAHFYGFQFGTFIEIETCCPPHISPHCIPGFDNDWATQGNDVGRTNSTSASLSSLCGLQTLWSHEFTGDVQVLSAAIAGPFVVVTSTDSIHCLEKATGAPVWSRGGFPYILGDVRGTPTIELDDSALYVPGADAQSFTRFNLYTGAVVWSRNPSGSDPPYVPLSPGATRWTPSLLDGGFLYFTQETGEVRKLDKATGLDGPGSPLSLPDAPLAQPYNALTSDGLGKLYVGTADAIGTDGNIHQIDAASLTIDWTLNNPGFLFTGDPVYYSPEGFPGSMAYEAGILYYHSLIRDYQGYGFPQTGSVGAIDVAQEDGSGSGIFWVNNIAYSAVASPGLTPGSSDGFSGPALGLGMVYLSSRGLSAGTVEPDGLSAWDKHVGVRIWYRGYTDVGTSGDARILDDVRSDAPLTLFCQPDQIPCLFSGHADGTWRLSNALTGEQLWKRQFTGRVRQTAMVNDLVVVVTHNGGPGAGGGTVVAMAPGTDRPRLQIDSQYVFRAATPDAGVTINYIDNAIANTGCVDLNVSAYNPTGALAARVTSVHPSLLKRTIQITGDLEGYTSFLDVPPKLLAIARPDLHDDPNTDLRRTFANAASAAADPLFLTAVTGPATVASGRAASILITYDVTGLANNTAFVNYIELVTDDPDYFPQDTTYAVLGDPAIEVTLFVGCPDAQATMTTGLGTIWVNNFGAGAGGGNFGSLPDNFVVNGNDANMFDGGWALVVQDSLHWAFDGCSVRGYPRRAGEFGPTVPACGDLTISQGFFTDPCGYAYAYRDVNYRMIDLASTNGFFLPASRQCGGVLIDVQRVASQDAAFGDFVLTAITLINESGAPGDIPGDMADVYFGGVTDWDISTNDNLYSYAAGYAQTDNAALDRGQGSWACGHVRLDAPLEGSGSIGSGGSPTFMAADIQDDQGHGDAAMRMMQDPAGYCATVDPASCANTDVAALWVAFYTPNLAEGASATFYHAIYQIENGVNGLPWNTPEEFDRAVAEVMSRAKGYAGFGKGDATGDGVVDLQDLVLVGNIVDGLFYSIGTLACLAADVDGDGDIDETDYHTLYDVVAGLQPPSVFANAWRF